MHCYNTRKSAAMEAILKHSTEIFESEEHEDWKRYSVFIGKDVVAWENYEHVNIQAKKDFGTSKNMKTFKYPGTLRNRN